VKPSEAAKRLGVGIDRIRTYCRIARVEKVGCAYDIPEETLERWRRHPPGTALDYRSTVAGRALEGQPIAGENYNPDTDDVRLARAYRQAKLDLRIALAEVARAHQALAKIQKLSRATVSECLTDYTSKTRDAAAVCESLMDALVEIEEMT
jgi:hypothetical protein